MKKILSVTLIFAFLLLFTSCSSAVSPRTDMLRSPFRCEISWREGGGEFCAEVSMSGESFSLAMTSPTETVGLSVKGADELLLYIDGVEAGRAPSSFSYISELFRSRDPFSFLSLTELEGVGVSSYSRSGATWYFSSADGRPVGFDDGSVFFKINWIEGTALQNENIDAYR